MANVSQTQEGKTPEGWMPLRDIRHGERQSPENKPAEQSRTPAELSRSGAKRPEQHAGQCKTPETRSFTLQGRETQWAGPPSSWSEVVRDGKRAKNGCPDKNATPESKEKYTPTKLTVLKREHGRTQERGYTLADYTPGGRGKDQIMTLHQRLGHATLTTMREAVNNGDAAKMGLKISQKEMNACKQLPCDTCRRSRIVRRSFPKNTKEQRIMKRPKTVLEQVYTDTAGPRRKRSKVITDRHGHKAGGNKHWQIAKDGYSNYLWKVPVKNKASIPKHLKRMEIEMEIDAQESSEGVRGSLAAQYAPLRGPASVGSRPRPEPRPCELGTKLGNTPQWPGFPHARRNPPPVVTPPPKCPRRCSGGWRHNSSERTRGSCAPPWCQPSRWPGLGAWGPYHSPSSRRRVWRARSCRTQRGGRAWSRRCVWRGIGGQMERGKSRKRPRGRTPQIRTAR